MRFHFPYFLDHSTQTKSFRRGFAKLEQAIRQARTDFQEAIRPLLPLTVAQLMDARLHDAYIDILNWDETTRQLILRLTECGDGYESENGAVGFFCLTLTYYGVTLLPDQKKLLARIAYEPSAQIAFHEIDILHGDAPLVFIQRTLWNTHLAIRQEGNLTVCWTPELEIHFTALDVESVPWEAPFPAPVRDIIGLTESDTV